MASNTPTASASAEVAADAAPAPDVVSYRVLPKGAGLIYTGGYDGLTGEPFTFDRGDVVDGVEPEIAAELEDRGLVEILGPA